MNTISDRLITVFYPRTPYSLVSNDNGRSNGS
jgi:hypothetical protein